MLSSLERRRRLYATFFVLGSLLWVYYVVAAIDWKYVAGIEVNSQRAQARMDSAQALLVRAPGVERRINELTADLREGRARFIAPADSSLAWANSRIQAAARAAGFQPHEVEISTISGRASPWAKDPMLHDVLEVLQVRVNVTAPSAKVASLIARIEAADPLVTLSRMVDTPTIQDANMRKVGIVWEWPKWADTPEAARVRGLIATRD